MNDRDLSRPATRHRTSNAARPGLRRIANTRTSNELTETPPSESGKNLITQPHHRKSSRTPGVPVAA
jgi:hypothetical protein